MRLALAATGVIALAGCNAFDKYLKVTSPEQIPTGLAEQPQNAELLSFSAVGDFECAYGVSVVINGLVSGELIDGTLTAARWDYDRRSFDHTTPTYSTGTCDGSVSEIGQYTPIQTARHTNDRVLQLLRGWTDAQVAPNSRQQLIDTAAVYAAYSRLLLGETMCTAPDSEFGQALTPAQIFAKAEALFTLVIDSVPVSALGEDTTIRTVAFAGRARARLDQGNLAGAAADAALIPAGFEFDATATGGGASSHRQNRINAQQTGRNISVQAAYRGLTVTGTGGTVPDTRVAVARNASPDTNASDRVTPLFISLKNSSAATPLRVASYQEAQLIIAEANGGSAASVTAINNARVADGLPPYNGPTDAASVAAQVTEERRRELFLEGKRLFDIRRLSLPLDPAPGLTYSTADRKGGTYQNQTCFPLPDVEKFNNPGV
jgi:starch-binding outer membrane protein, SusD/RagB family